MFGVKEEFWKYQNALQQVVTMGDKVQREIEDLQYSAVPAGGRAGPSGTGWDIVLLTEAGWIEAINIQLDRLKKLEETRERLYSQTESDLVARLESFGVDPFKIGFDFLSV